jgi:hypothetical protein
MTRHLTALAVLAAVMVPAPPAAAQITESRVFGRATDQTGAVLPGGTISITSQAPGAITQLSIRYLF